jgi:hypothetical protein
MTMLDGGGGGWSDNDPKPTKPSQAVIDEHNKIEAEIRADVERVAAEDALVGINRDEDWIKQSVDAQTRERTSRVIKLDPILEAQNLLIRARDLRSAFEAATEGRYGSEIQLEVRDFADQWLKDAITQGRIEKAAEIARDEVFKTELQAAVEKKENEIKEAYSKRHLEQTQLTMRTVFGMLLAVFIPIIGMLPGMWQALQIVPVLIIAKMNWGPIMKLREGLKQAEREYAEVSANSASGPPNS